MGRSKKVRFGQYIRELRTAKGITLREFARQLDVSPTYVSQIEQDKFSPPAEERIVRMAQILGVDVDELLALAGRVAEDNLPLGWIEEPLPQLLLRRRIGLEAIGADLRKAQ